GRAVTGRRRRSSAPTSRSRDPLLLRADHRGRFHRPGDRGRAVGGRGVAAARGARAERAPRARGAGLADRPGPRGHARAPVDRVPEPLPQRHPRGVAVTARGAHLVGSVPLASAEAVFTTLASELGDRLRRMPDGETGPRSDWIVWQLPVFTSQPRLEVVPPAPDGWRPLPRVRLEDGARAEDVRFEALGYADAAIASYRVFARLKRDGRVPVGCRFQVCLPTPLAPISAFVVPEHQGALEPAYETRLLAELRLVLHEVPHDQLAVQWDTNFEFGMLEGVFPVWFDDVKGGILERLLRLSRQVPADVELGYHFCYGDVQHRHYKEPRDAGKLVEIANALAASLGRPLHWIHMPVPRDRADEAYYAPLAGLRLRPETELYLGLVHHTDGVAGTARRIDVARRFAADFGIATE